MRPFLSAPVAILLAGVVLGLTGITWIRAAYDGHHAAIESVLLWQTAVWAPWAIFGYLVFVLAKVVPFDPNRTIRCLLPNVLAAVVITALHYLWFRFISDQISPYIELEETRYGVFAYFFVFWSALDLAIYGLLFAFAHSRDLFVEQQENRQRVAELEETLSEWGSDSRQTERVEYLLVRKSGKRQIVSVKGICWIEAEGYYAGLHTKDGRFLIRESLASLTKKLDPLRFVRVHRSTIVNMEFVDFYTPGGDGNSVIRLLDGTTRPVSRTGRRRLESQLLQ